MRNWKGHNFSVQLQQECATESVVYVFSLFSVSRTVISVFSLFSVSVFSLFSVLGTATSVFSLFSILGTVTSMFSLFSVSVFSLFSVLGTVTSNGPSVDSRFFTLEVKDLTFLASASSLGDSCHNT